MTTYTRTGLLTQMQADMGRTSSAFQTAAGLAIDRAIVHYQGKRFWFNESRSTTFNTVAGTDTYAFNTATTTGAITAQFYKIDGVWITIAANDIRELERVDYDDVEGYWDENTTQGEPLEYAYINRGIRLWRNPDAVYSVRIAGHIKVAAPASDGETDNPWMTEAYDLIMCRAKAELYAHRLEDPGNAALMREAERDALNRLISDTYDKTAPGYLTATEF